MSLALTISPLRDLEELRSGWALCYNRLAFDQDYRIFEQIEQFNYPRISKNPILHPQPIPPNLTVWFYEDEGIDKTREDPYGTGLTFLYAKEMKKLEIPEDASPLNKAIKSFIDALPGDMPIILQWR